MARPNFDPWFAGDYYDMQTVTPSDSTDLTTPARGLYVTAAGNVKVTTWGGTSLTIAVQQYQTLTLGVARVWSTGTTATVLACF